MADEESLVSPTTHKKEISIQCSNQDPLVGTIYIPSSEVKAAVLIGPATGIKQGFYAAFATHLAEQGFGCLTFDNHGIGASLKGPLSKCKATLRSWGQVDLPSAFEALKKAFPNAKYHLIGHSAGGQLVGLMHNAHEFSSMFNYACSSGSLRNMNGFFYWQAQFFMNMFIPISNSLFGYANSQWVGMGEPLPKLVAQEWSEWCNKSGYTKAAFGKTIQQHWYHELDFPSIWLNATDDPIALDVNVADMISVFHQLPAGRKSLHPADYGYPDIGHMKFFSRKRQALWALAIDWLEEHSN